jgi:two-component system, cell cycle response regulator CpdR
MKRILVVEDDASVRTFTARALSVDGHQVEMAEDGMEGLEIITRDAGGFDLILSDIRMPAMDGIEMAKEATASFPSLRILLMTGFADQRERASDLEQVVIDVVDKPFTLADIRSAVSRALTH